MITVQNKGNDYKDYHLTHLRYYVNRVVHLYGGLTLAYKLSKDTKKNGFPTVKITYGIALCSQEDGYNKKSGRDTAVLRVNLSMTGNSTLFSEKNGIPVFTGAGMLFLDIPEQNINLDNELYPSRWLHKSIVKTILEHARTVGLKTHFVTTNMHRTFNTLLDYREYDTLNHF